MNRLSIIVAVLGALLILPSVGGLAADKDDYDAQEKPPEKDMCALYASQCGTTAQSIQDKITRLQEAIAKGTKVYSPEEIRMLEQKLREANRRLDLFFDK